MIDRMFKGRMDTSGFGDAFHKFSQYLKELALIKTFIHKKKHYTTKFSQFFCFCFFFQLLKLCTVDFLILICMDYYLGLIL